MTDLLGPSFAEAIDAARLPRGVQVGRPHVHDTLFARDRTGRWGLIATIRPSGRGGERWYWSYEVRSWDGRVWSEENAQGDRWPLDPEAPRPATAGFEFLTHLNAGGLSDASFAHAVQGGVVGAPVASLEVVTPVERHDVEFDPATGSFAALALLHWGEPFELLARAADGTVLDSMEWSGE